MKRIGIGFFALLVAVAMVSVAAAGAAGFPTKRITYNICFNPGGESDITARFQEQPLKKYLGVDVVIQYKIGGGEPSAGRNWSRPSQTATRSPVTTFPTPSSSLWKWAMPGTSPWTSSKSICSRAPRMS
jgi:tripartite-type tricarboxylate transporter receptor subunit TctC